MPVIGPIPVDLATDPRSAISGQAMEAAPAECEPAAMDAEDFLYMLYTSGSTGKPKGLVHSVAGYLLYCMFTQRVSSMAGRPGRDRRAAS